MVKVAKLQGNNEVHGTSITANAREDGYCFLGRIGVTGGALRLDGVLRGEVRA